MGKKLLFIIFGLIIVFQFGAIYYLYTQVVDIKSELEMSSGSSVINFPSTNQIIKESINQGCGDDCKEEIKMQVEEKIKEVVEALPTSVPVSTSETTQLKTTQQTSYIQLGTTASTTSTDWYTVDASSSFIDLKNDFNENAYVTFEASLKVQHGNGKAYVRLWDDTNKVAVNASELSTDNNSDYKHAKSGKIYLWSGNNEYKVQIKSLNGFEVTYTNGKVKVVY